MQRFAPVALQELTQAACDLPTTTPQVHAANITTHTDGSLAAVWYGGSREGGRDVSIYLSRYNNQGWAPAQVLLTHASLHTLSGKKRVRRIGNPVLHQDIHGRWHLFVVTATFGGWACARIEHLWADTLEEPFCYRQRLALRPWPNISHLVRAPAYNLKNGNFVLPVYFEMGRKKYGLLLYLNTYGHLLQRQVLPGPTHLLQPWPVHYPDGRTGFFLRDAHGYNGGNGKVWYCEQVPDVQLSGAATNANFTRPNPTLHATTGNFEPVRALSLANADSGIAAYADSGGGVWLAHNPNTQNYPWRTALVLERLDPALNPVHQIWLESSNAALVEYSYPSLTLDHQGRLHVLYTHERTKLRHRIFAGVDT